MLELIAFQSYSVDLIFSENSRLSRNKQQLWGGGGKGKEGKERAGITSIDGRLGGVNAHGTLEIKEKYR
jgi:hypothetical protein